MLKTAIRWVFLCALAASVVACKTGSTASGSAQDEALLNAAILNDLEGVKKALADGANVNATSTVQNQEGNTALLKAAEWGSIEMATLLLDKGADINRANELGATPLHAAASHNFVPMVKFLLAKGADVTKKSKFGATAKEVAKKRNITPKSRECEIILAEALNKAGVPTEVPAPYNPSMAG